MEEGEVPLGGSEAEKTPPPVEEGKVEVVLINKKIIFWVSKKKLIL